MVVAVLLAVQVARASVVMVAFTAHKVQLALPTQARAAAAVWGHLAPALPTAVRVLQVSSSFGTSVAVLALEAQLLWVRVQLRATRCTPSHQAVHLP